MPADASAGARSWKNGVPPVWCPGCGHYAVLQALGTALARTDLRPDDVCWVSGIGCACRLPCYLRGYAFHGAHGRALPTATGVTLANPALRVIVTMGDGDALSIGAGHLPHACRRNPGLVCLVMDNGVYGMTQGQPSATGAPGNGPQAAPDGGVGTPLDPAAIALASGASFVARASAAHGEEMAGLFSSAFAHRGFAFVHVLSPCAAYNPAGSFQALRASVRPLAGPLPDRAQAVAAALRREPSAVGIFWQETRPTLEEAVVPPRAPADTSLAAILDRYA
jgi:2-oxoglutarate ferredoxin oxidoreductase subunit beta